MRSLTLLTIFLVGCSAAIPEPAVPKQKAEIPAEMLKAPESDEFIFEEFKELRWECCIVIPQSYMTEEINRAKKRPMRWSKKK
jgi:hypothetical protein